MYERIGYAGTFYFFAAAIIVSIFVCIICIPNHLNKVTEQPTVVKDTDHHSTDITYCSFITSISSLILLLVCYNNMNNLCYVDPTLGPQLNKLGAPDIYTGYAFGIESSFGVLGSSMAIDLFSLIGAKRAILIACFLQTFSLMFLGPS